MLKICRIFFTTIILCLEVNSKDPSYVSQWAEEKGNNLIPPEMIMTYGNWTVLPNTTDTGPIQLVKNNENEAFNIILACKAPYPVKMVYRVNERNEITSPVENGFRNKIFYTNFYDPSTYIFYVRMNFKFVFITNATTFTCQSIANPCLQQAAHFTFSDSNHMNITLQNKTKTCTTPAPAPPVSTTLQPKPDETDDDCDAHYWYEATSINDASPYYAFRCSFADGSSGVIRRFDCSNKPKCQAIYDKYGGLHQTKKCWSQYAHGEPGTCQSCQAEKVNLFNAFVAVCTKGSVYGIYEETTVRSLAFYGVPQGAETRPKIFFSEEDIEPTEMIYLEEFQELNVLGGSIKAYCRLSGYYNSASFQFALEILGHRELLLLPQPPENQTSWKNEMYWEQTMMIKLDDPNTVRIYCFGNIQDTYSWINTSRPITFKKDERGSGTSSVGSWTISLIVISVTVIVILGFALLWLRWRRNGRMRNLTSIEIKNFLEGNSNLKSSNDYEDQVAIYTLPYNKSYEMSRSSIQPDESNILGVGEFGVVMKGTVVKNETKQVVAIKTTKSTVDVEVFLAFLSEIKIMAFLGRHQNVVSLVAACTNSIKRREALAALEFCSFGDLQNFLRRHRCSFQNLFQYTSHPYVCTSYVSHYEMGDEQSASGIILSSLDLLKFACGAANGMNYLSKKKVIHGDLAARNVFLTDKLEVKIGDFGLSSLLQNSNYIKKREGKIPFKWYSIEAIKEGKFSTKADVWSFGILLWEICSLGQNPYPGLEYWDEFLKKLESGYRMEMPLYANNEMFTMMKECWHEETWKRPPFLEIYRRILQNVYTLDSQKDYMPLE